MPRHTPTVSIVIPFYNAQKTLERAVRSILDQTYADFELILVDNNSTDDSVHIAWFLAANDSRIKLICEKKQGVAYAANAGIATAKGKYIARMDADDISLPLRIEKQVQLLDKNPEIDVASCLVKHIPHHNNTSGIETYIEWVNSLTQAHEIYINRFIEMPVINPTVMYRSILHDKHGVYTHGDFPEDYDLWLRWLCDGVKIKKIPEILFHWYDSDTRLTRSDERYRTEAFYNVKAEYLAQWLIKKQMPYVWIWGAGRKSRQRAQLLEEKGIWIEGYIDVKERNFTDICCIHYEQFNWNAPSFILSYVGNRGARNKIREYLKSKGKTEGENFLLIA